MARLGKKSLAVLLVMAFLFALTGCAAETPAPSEPAPAPEAENAAPVEEVVEAEPELDWPKKPITLLTASSSGSGNDTLLRVVAQYLSQEWDVQVNVTNESGGNGIPAVTTLYDSKADGYTLFGDAALSSSYQLIRDDVPYDVMGRTFISRIASQPQVLVASKDTGWKSLDDAAEGIKADPANFVWGGIGGNSAADFAQVAYMTEIGVDHTVTKKVIQSGGGAILTAAAGGHVQFGSAAAASVPAYVESDSLVAVAVCGADRLEILPDVPTAIEQGYNVKVGAWIGLSAPAGLDPAIAAYVDETVQKILTDEQFVADIAKLGCIPDYADAAQMVADIQAEAEQARNWSSQAQ